MKWIALAVFGSLGAVALVGGLYWAFKRYEIVKNGIMVQGKVVDQEENVSSGPTSRHTNYSRSHISYYPVVEFKTEAGERVRFTGSTGGGREAIMETGTIVNVIYLPRDPSAAVIVEFKQAWLGPAVLSVVGLVLLLMASGTFVLMGKSDKTFEAMQDMMHRDALTMRSDSLQMRATILGIKPYGGKRSGKFVFVCSGVRPGEPYEEEFYSDFFDFEPDSAFIGRTVNVYLDPSERENYYVELGPLLKEILNRKNLR